MREKIKHIQKNLNDYDLGRFDKGSVRIFSYNPVTCEVLQVIERPNLVLYSGADILSQLVAGNVSYALTTMYLEFKNGVMAPVTPPAFDRTGGIDYYTGLSVSPDVDFLRVPLSANPVIDSTDEVLYSGNRSTFFAMSEGSVGRHGKAFSAAALSAVYGVALAATPEPENPDQDIIYARSYTNVSTIFKTTGTEIGVTWSHKYE